MRVTKYKWIKGPLAIGKTLTVRNPKTGVEVSGLCVGETKNTWLLSIKEAIKMYPKEIFRAFPLGTYE